MEAVIVVALIGSASTLLALPIGWYLARDKNKAEAEKSRSEAALSQAKADQLSLTTSVETVVSEKLDSALCEFKAEIGEVSSTLADHTAAINRLENGVEIVKHEVTTNTGTSIKDAVIRIEGWQKGIERSLNVLDGGRASNHQSIQGLAKQLTRIEDTVHEMAKDYKTALSEHDSIQDEQSKMKKRIDALEVLS